MGKYKPYRDWDRDTLFQLIKAQAYRLGYSKPEIIELKNIIYDARWDPTLDFNGCTFVQDKYHPSLACMRHDFNWVVNKGGIEYDRKFRDDLLRAGFSKPKASIFYIAVRLYWVIYYQWVN